MPQILFIALGACFLYYAYRWFRAEAQRVDAAIKKADSKLRRKQDVVTTLAIDPATGEYRPQK